jgi:three-Cys-motif partner protein
MSAHTFGGNWTEEKLACLGKYLAAYRTIFTSNAKAQHLRTWYVDAFAGTGTRTEPGQPVEDQQIFNEVYAETNEYRAGSARIALDLTSPFDRYLFVEESRDRVNQLRATISADFSALEPRCDIRQGDANTILKDWCRERDWRKERAVVFLDPYGMQVEWSTITTLAATKAVDLWYLFPLGVGVARLLTHDGNIAPAWQARLELLFGTGDWKSRFYKVTKRQDLFGDIETVERDAPVEKIAAFIHERLVGCFAEVADGLILRNSKASPLYLLCFAAANERGAKTALRIAQSILNG